MNKRTKLPYNFVIHGMPRFRMNTIHYSDNHDEVHEQILRRVFHSKHLPKTIKLILN